jgi:hypothetical protein
MSTSSFFRPYFKVLDAAIDPLKASWYEDLRALALQSVIKKVAYAYITCTTMLCLVLCNSASLTINMVDTPSASSPNSGTFRQIANY